MAELLAKLCIDDNDREAAIEAADVMITFMRMFERLGVDYHDMIDEKMAINRQREWNLDGQGHGYHK